MSLLLSTENSYGNPNCGNPSGNVGRNPAWFGIYRTLLFNTGPSTCLLSLLHPLKISLLHPFKIPKKNITSSLQNSDFAKHKNPNKIASYVVTSTSTVSLPPSSRLPWRSKDRSSPVLATVEATVAPPRATPMPGRRWRSWSNQYMAQLEAWASCPQTMSWEGLVPVELRENV